MFGDNQTLACRATRSNVKPADVLVIKEFPSQQVDELKSVIFKYVVLAPLLSALLADKIDNFLLFVCCLWDSWGRLSYI